MLAQREVEVCLASVHAVSCPALGCSCRHMRSY